MVASLERIGVGVLEFRVRVFRGWGWNFEDEEVRLGEEKKMEEEKKEMDAISSECVKLENSLVSPEEERAHTRTQLPLAPLSIYPLSPYLSDGSKDRPFG